MPQSGSGRAGPWLAPDMCVSVPYWLSTNLAKPVVHLDTPVYLHLAFR
jgi:hypothetical protein